LFFLRILFWFINFSSSKQSKTAGAHGGETPTVLIVLVAVAVRESFFINLSFVHYF